MPKNVLVVDDEQDVCSLVKSILEREGEFKVSIAICGRDGLYQAKRYKPDLVILDLMMPDLDGTEVAQTLLEDPSTKDIPIIFLTALAQKDEVESGMIRERNLIAKPVSPEELIYRVKEVLSKAQGS
jgi:DNA-binding response OmpR family regulator